MFDRRVQFNLAVCRRLHRVGGRRGYLLLEMVMSVALLLVGLTVIGSQFQQGWEAAHKTEDMTRVLMLAESKLAELETGLVNLDLEADDEAEGDFTLRFPDYGWRMRFVETAIEGLRMITLEILFSPREDLDDDFDFDAAKVVQSVYTMRADPAMVNLEVDYGLEEEAIDQIREVFPDSDLDVENFDMARPFRDLPIEDLILILPTLLQAMGISQDAFLALAPPEVRDLLKEGLGTNEEEEGGQEVIGTGEDREFERGGRQGGRVDPKSLKEGGGR